jgi:glycosyltransferase involved in cell wall biosynthesis
MKILYHHRIAARDGMDVHKSELIKAFRALGHEVVEVGPSTHQKAKFGDGGGLVDVARRFLPRIVSEVLEILYDRHAYRRLEEAWLLEKPDFLYERHNLFLAAGKRLKEKYDMPFYLEVNAPLAEERSNNGGLALSKFAHAQEGAVWRAADRVFPVTQVLAGYLEAKGVDTARIEVMPNAVNPQVFHRGVDGSPVRARYGLEDALVLGFTGFIRDWHGLDQIIAALPDLAADKNVHLLIVGDGPARAGLEDQAVRTGVAGRVHFTGLQSRENIAPFIAAFDIALQPAVTPYASPLKIFEYLAMGKLVLAPDMANIREIIEEGVNGLLFPLTSDEDGDTLTKAIAQALDNKDIAQRPSDERTWRDNAARILGSVNKNSDG